MKVLHVKPRAPILPAHFLHKHFPKVNGWENEEVRPSPRGLENREKLKKIAPRSWKHALKMIRFKLNVLNKRKR